ncbi:MAG: alkaline phosphatase family protein [Candidatus Micrarchaeia archaeon]
MQKNKYLFIVLDGAGDRKCKELDGETPLEAAKKENIDELSKKCEFGLIKVLPYAPESDEALLSLFGYKLQKTYRGSFEAIGLGMEVGEKDLCFRANFATEENGKIVDRRVARSLTVEESKALAKEINEKVKLENANFKFKAIGYRGAIVFSSKFKLSSSLSNTDEAYSRFKGVSIANNKKINKKTKGIPVVNCKALSKSKAAIFSANIVNSFIEKSKNVLENSKINKIREEEKKLKANIILLRDPCLGIPKLKKLKDIYKIKFCAIAQMPVEIGISKVLGMKIKKISEKISYSELASIAKDSLKECDFVYLHIKGPDEFGHDGNAIGKKECIEAIDKEFFSKIKKIKAKIAITSDHSTPCSLRAHSSDPVPFLIYPGNKKLKNFCEKECKKGIKINGNEFLRYFISK